MISHLHLRSLLAASAEPTRSNRAFKARIMAKTYRTTFFAAGLMIGLSACSTAAAPPPKPAANKIFVKTKLDPKIRTEALAGGHPISADFPMKVLVFLTSEDPAEFNRTLAATEDPNSPNFGHHLTPQELERFGRPISEYDEIERWLGLYGIKVLSADPTALIATIRVEGTSAQFEAALNVRIYQSSDGVRFANMSDPQIPEKFDGIIAGFAGLDNLSGYAGGPGELVQ